MVDPERLASLLRRLDGEVAYLRRRADEGEGPALLADEERLSGLKYRFVTALETVINVAQHLAATQRWPVPTSNADSLRQLGRQRVVEDALAERLAGAVGFRNVLVHAYADVDDQRVIAALDDVGDLEAFSVAVARWATDPTSSDLRS